MQPTDEDDALSPDPTAAYLSLMSEESGAFGFASILANVIASFAGYGLATRVESLDSSWRLAIGVSAGLLMGLLIVFTGRRFPPLEHRDTRARRVESALNSVAWGCLVLCAFSLYTWAFTSGIGPTDGKTWLFLVFIVFAALHIPYYREHTRRERQFSVALDAWVQRTGNAPEI